MSPRFAFHVGVGEERPQALLEASKMLLCESETLATLADGVPAERQLLLGPFEAVFGCFQAAAEAPKLELSGPSAAR
jgi:hypothetical protein